MHTGLNWFQINSLYSSFIQPLRECLCFSRKRNTNTPWHLFKEESEMLEHLGHRICFRFPGLLLQWRMAGRDPAVTQALCFASRSFSIWKKRGALLLGKGVYAYSEGQGEGGGAHVAPLFSFPFLPLSLGLCSSRIPALPGAKNGLASVLPATHLKPFPLPCRKYLITPVFSEGDYMSVKSVSPPWVS